jgi:hypothetical protein
MDKPTMQTLTMGRQFAFLGGQAATGLFVASAVMPTFFALLDASLGIIVLWVVGTTLPREFPLEASFLALIGFQLLAESPSARSAIGSLVPPVQ